MLARYLTDSPLLLPGAAVDAVEYRVDAESSILAVMTHKGGVASGLAHNHLMAVTDYDARPADFLGSGF